MSEMCAYCRNYFLVDYLHPDERIHYGTYTISGTSIGDLPFLQHNQWFRIVGSALNDGVHQWIDQDNPGLDLHTVLVDETFTGAIWAMSVPPDFEALKNDIQSWIAANGSAINSPYQSESFGGYSYSKSSGGASGNASAAYGWQDQFAARLAPYRRLSVL